ncbi:transcriptional regulator [Streptomyces sp. NPDC057702]|uniref:transcriptional regulator n=1 Tax=unclassified Streptomyces TaxID=2593676 RepID=UPI0036C15D9F
MRVGMGEVEAVKALTNQLSALDDEYGGQHARPMAAAFLVNTVAPYLRAEASEEVRRAMQHAAAMASYVTGWMAVDEGLHGLAQQYYVKGLELARMSGDRMAYCHILRGMSVQAADLGHGPTARHLAEVSAGAAPSSSPRMRAFITGQQAYAYAVAGDRTRAWSALREAERAVSQAESPVGRLGGFSAATLAYATAQVHVSLGDTKSSVRSLHDHFKLRDHTDSRRSELLHASLLAERQIATGYLDAACATWDRVLTAYPAMHSGRVDARVRSATRLLTPHLAHPLARQTHDRARSLLAQRSARVQAL